MDILRLGGLFVVLVPWYGRERPSARGDGMRPQQIVVYPKCLPLPPARSCRVSSRQGTNGQAGLDAISKRGASFGLSAVQANSTPHQHPSLMGAWRAFTGPSLAWRTQAIALQSPSTSVAPNPSCPRPCSCPNTTTWLHHHREVFLEHRHAKLRVPLHQRIDQRFSRPCPARPPILPILPARLVAAACSPQHCKPLSLQ
jgi:hypothetical protein